MKYRIEIKKLLCASVFLTLAAALFTVNSYAENTVTVKENTSSDFVAGKIEFIDKNGTSGIAVIDQSEKAYLLNKGVSLFVRRGGDKLVLKITDTAEKYIKCSIDSENTKSVLKHGDEVYYSDSLNSGAKYRDAKKILSGLISLYENFILKIESTEDTAVIADAVKNFSSELDSLIPEMKRINRKYPELDKFKISPPEELSLESAKLDILEPRLRDAFFKINMYGTDPAIKKAAEDLHRVLGKMNSRR